MKETRSRGPKFVLRKQDVRDIEIQDNKRTLREMSIKWPRGVQLFS